MILEALTHLLTPAPRYVKKMGYFKEAIAIEARARRCKTAWQPHLDKCKSLILEQAESLPSDSHVMILGSGGFHDVPVKRLLELGHRITCVDIVHLPRVMRQYTQVTFVEKDLTGVAEDLYYGRKIDTGFDWVPEVVPDLTVSLNLLSQLPLGLVGYAERNGFALPEGFAESVTKAHLEWMRDLSSEALLISDLEREYSVGGEVVETKSALSDELLTDLGDHTERWDWDIAPTGEIDKEIRVVHRVGAWKV